MAIIYSSKSNANAGLIGHLDDLTRVLKEAKKLDVKSNPFDIEDFLLKLNFIILKEELGDDLSGYVEKRHAGWVIGLNKYQSPRRQRFTMAHEFGHFVLHKSQLEKRGRWEDELLMRSDERNLIEKQANEFASELLMPKKEFEAAVKNGEDDVDKLANRFEVSIAAARYRAFKLGYLERY